MGRVLFIFVAVVAALWWLRRRISGRRDAPRTPAPPPASAEAPAAPQTMVACAHCGVHLPQVEALFDPQGRPFCSPAHRQAGPGA